MDEEAKPKRKAKDNPWYKLETFCHWAVMVNELVERRILLLFVVCAWQPHETVRYVGRADLQSGVTVRCSQVSNGLLPPSSALGRTLERLCVTEPISAPWLGSGSYSKSCCRSPTCDGGCRRACGRPRLSRAWHRVAALPARPRLSRSTTC